jgi:hypothetical protein
MGYDVSDFRESGGVGTVPQPEQSSVGNPAAIRPGLVGAIAGCIYTVAAGAVALLAANLAGDALRPLGWGGPSLAVVRVGTTVSLGMLAGYYSGRGIAAIRRDLSEIIRRLGR